MKCVHNTGILSHFKFIRRERYSISLKTAENDADESDVLNKNLLSCTLEYQHNEVKETEALCKAKGVSL